MIAACSPLLDCLAPAPDGPQDATVSFRTRAVGDRKKVARRASFQLFCPTSRTSGPPCNTEGRNAR